ncbi:MAG: glycosyltransferase family A protein, partial [Candidatus Nanopelagicales bacterium]
MAPAEHPIASRWSIAVIIALYNGERFIDETLRSVFAQSLSPDEIIVVDDGSTDGGPQIVEKLAEKHPITLIKGEHRGQSAARNFGIDSTTSDLIALLDHDDTWYPRHLEKLRRPFLDTHRDRHLGWVYSDVDEM